MYYIIGTKITLQSRTIPTVKKGMTSQQLAEISRLKKGTAESNSIREQFKPNREYTLIRVYMEDGKVAYKFADTTGGIVVAKFNSVTAAENFISEIRGEDVPDYTEMHMNKSD